MHGALDLFQYEGIRFDGSCSGQSIARFCRTDLPKRPGGMCPHQRAGIPEGAGQRLDSLGHSRVPERDCNIAHEAVPTCAPDRRPRESVPELFTRDRDQ